MHNNCFFLLQITLPDITNTETYLKNIIKRKSSVKAN